MKYPEISVIIPVYNGARDLPRSVQSALKQELECEIIIVDDGSTDNTLQVASAFAKQFPDRIYVIAQANAGAGGARNTGLRFARGTYCGFLDCDDAYLPGFFLAAHRVLTADPKVLTAVCRVQLANLHRPVEPWHLELIEASIPCNLLARKEIVSEIGFPIDRAFRGAAGGEDCAFREQLHAAGPAVLLYKPFYTHTVRPRGHFDLFMDRTTMENGNPKFKFQTKEEADGSIHKATHRFRMSVQDGLVLRGTAAFNRVCKFAEEVIRLQREVATGPDCLPTIDGYMLRWLYQYWPIPGTNIVVASEESAFRNWLTTVIKPSSAIEGINDADGLSQVNTIERASSRWILRHSEKVHYIQDILPGQVNLSECRFLLMTSEVVSRMELSLIMREISNIKKGGLLSFQKGNTTVPVCDLIGRSPKLFQKLVETRQVVVFRRI